MPSPIPPNISQSSGKVSMSGYDANSVSYCSRFICIQSFQIVISMAGESTVYFCVLLFVSLFGFPRNDPARKFICNAFEIRYLCPPNVLRFPTLFQSAENYYWVRENGYFQGSVVAIPLSTQNPVLATGCGFDPRHRHHKAAERLLFSVDLPCGFIREAGDDRFDSEPTDFSLAFCFTIGIIKEKRKVRRCPK